MAINEHQFNLPLSQFVFTSENFKQMSKLRIIQKNLVHVKGFPNNLLINLFNHVLSTLVNLGKLKK